MAHAHFMLDNSGYTHTHTFTICYTYCLPTTTKFCTNAPLCYFICTLPALPDGKLCFHNMPYLCISSCSSTRQCRTSRISCRSQPTLCGIKVSNTKRHRYSLLYPVDVRTAVIIYMHQNMHINCIKL